MIITIFDSKETTFESRGLGTLPDAHEAEVQEEINGVYDLQMLYPRTGLRADLIERERVLKASTPKGPQLFRIVSVRKDLDFIDVHALHIFYDLKDNFIEDTNIVNKSGAGALSQVLSVSTIPHSFTSWSDIQGLRNCRLVRENTIDAIMGRRDNTLLSRWGGQIERDNFDIRWHQRMGHDRGVRIKYRKNLTGIDFTLDTSKIATRIMPQGFDALFLPEKYIDSPLINEYHTVKVRKINYGSVVSELLSPEQDDAVPHAVALERLRSAAQAEFDAGIDKPIVNCTVDFVDLAQTCEYRIYASLERVFLGDTVHIEHPEIGVDLSEQVIAYRWDALKEKYLNITLGRPENGLFNALSGAQSAGQQALDEIEQLKPSILETAQQAATALINAGFGGHVRIHPDKVLIMDTEDEATAMKVWQWNINGLGYSSTGVAGPYETAMVDGKLIGDMIVANSITANQLASDVGQMLDIWSNEAILSRVTKEQVMTDPEIIEALQGEPGATVVSFEPEYARSESDTIPPTEGWSEEV